MTLSVFGAATALVAGFIASAVGGAVGAVLIGGRALGVKVAAFMGVFYGPLAGVAGVAIGLLALKFFG
jgi:hypothetical protein